MRSGGLLWILYDTSVIGKLGHSHCQWRLGAGRIAPHMRITVT